MGNGNWATAPNYATVVLSVYNQMLIDSGQAGQCPPDGLLFGPLTGAGPCPVSLRQPGRAIATTASGGSYVLSGTGAVSAYNGATNYGSPTLSDADSFRDIDVMPDGQGYVVLDEYGLVYKFGSAASPSTVGSLSMGYYPGSGRGALDRGDARRQGLPDPAQRRHDPEVRFRRDRRDRCARSGAVG